MWARSGIQTERCTKYGWLVGWKLGVENHPTTWIIPKWRLATRDQVHLHTISWGQEALVGRPHSWKISMSPMATPGPLKIQNGFLSSSMTSTMIFMRPSLRSIIVNHDHDLAKPAHHMGFHKSSGTLPRTNTVTRATHVSWLSPLKMFLFIFFHHLSTSSRLNSPTKSYQKQNHVPQNGGFQKYY